MDFHIYIAAITAHRQKAITNVSISHFNCDQQPAPFTEKFEDLTVTLSLCTGIKSLSIRDIPTGRGRPMTQSRRQAGDCARCLSTVVALAPKLKSIYLETRRSWTVVESLAFTETDCVHTDEPRGICEAVSESSIMRRKGTAPHYLELWEQLKEDRELTSSLSAYRADRLHEMLDRLPLDILGWDRVVPLAKSSAVSRQLRRSPNMEVDVHGRLITSVSPPKIKGILDEWHPFISIRGGQDQPLQFLLIERDSSPFVGLYGPTRRQFMETRNEPEAKWINADLLLHPEAPEEVIKEYIESFYTFYHGICYLRSYRGGWTSETMKAIPSPRYVRDLIKDRLLVKDPQYWEWTLQRYSPVVGKFESLIKHGRREVV